MRKICYISMLSSSIMVASLGSASALESSSVNIACSPTRKLQSSIDAVPAGTVATFNISGTCNENIVIPSGKTIIIKGANSNSKIIPSNAALPAITSNGDTTVQNLTVLNANGDAEAVMLADRGGYLHVIGSKVSGPYVGAVVAYYGSASGRISNSRVTGGSNDAVEVWDGSQLVVVGTPWDVAGPDGFRTVLSSTGSWAVGCGTGSSLAMRANTAGASGGGIELRNSRVGVFGNECSAQLENSTNNPANFLITGMSSEGAAIRTQKSAVNVRKLKIANNSGWAIDVQQSSVQLDGTQFSRNTKGDINSGYGSTVLFTGWYERNSIPQAFSSQMIECYPTQKSDVFIESAAINVPAGKNMSDLAANNPCVTLSD